MVGKELFQHLERLLIDDHHEFKHPCNSNLKMAIVLVAQLCFHYQWYYSPKFQHDFSTTIITSNNNSSNGSKSVSGVGILVSQPFEVVVLAFPPVDETP